MDNYTATELAYKNGYESGLDKMQSIIDVIYHQQMTDIENGICKAVLDVGINVDKERLTRAIEDARSFYAEGYKQGKKDAVKHGRWVKKPGERICPFCGYRYSYFGGKERNYCHHCGSCMDGGEAE